jgi:ketosteroid isomerase-like protein
MVAPEPARSPARDSLLRTDKARGDSVAARGVVAGLLSVFSPEVIYLRAGVPAVYGREAARAALSLPPAEDSRVSWEPLGGGVSQDLQAAYTYGITARSASAGQPIRFGRYIAYWERTRGRPWQVAAYVDIGGAPAQAGDSVFTPAQTTPPDRTLAPPFAEARASLRAADSLFSDLAYRMGTADAFGATVADYGVIFGSPDLHVGPAAVREGLKGQESTSLSWKPAYASIAGSRDLGFTVGEYVSTGRGPSGAAVQSFGKYLTVWRRQADGSWKFVADAGNGSPPRQSIER